MNRLIHLSHRDGRRGLVASQVRRAELRKDDAVGIGCGLNFNV